MVPYLQEALKGVVQGNVDAAGEIVPGVPAVLSPSPRAIYASEHIVESILGVASDVDRGPVRSPIPPGSGGHVPLSPLLGDDIDHPCQGSVAIHRGGRPADDLDARDVFDGNGRPIGGTSRDGVCSTPVDQHEDPLPVSTAIVVPPDVRSGRRPPCWCRWRRIRPASGPPQRCWWRRFSG